MRVGRSQVDGWSGSVDRHVGQQGAAPAKHVLVVVEHEDPEHTTRAYRVECVRKVLD